jgi:pimeloyl-ACP methyl ester carboxylesterase
MTTHFLELPDGRRLCYAEYGDPNGEPIFVFHGNPGSRLSWGVIPGSPFLPGIRLIAPDRPGYGQTDFAEGVTTLENWPNDVAALADSLGIEKFAVFGPSGGGPYALACAWKMPERLTSVGLFASVGPFIPETDKNINPIVRTLWSNVSKAPGLFRIQMRFFAWLARKAPGLYVKMILLEFSETDRKDYARLGVGNMIQADRNEGYRQKGIGTWYDVLLPSNWPIPLNEIKPKVFIWWGEEDMSAPLSMGQYMAEKIPNCEATFIKGVGHFWIFEHLDGMLAKLVERQPGGTNHSVSKQNTDVHTGNKKNS